MTTPTTHQGHQGEGWIRELATFLGPGCFPATHDHLTATLMGRGAPSHLLWHLSTLPRTRAFESLDELVGQLTESSVDVSTERGTDPS
jgi:hypothetical protein